MTGILDYCMLGVVIAVTLFGIGAIVKILSSERKRVHHESFGEPREMGV